MKITLCLLLCIFLFPNRIFAQGFEGEMILQLGGEDWDDLQAAPVIIYVKGEKTLTKVITPYFAEFVYTDLTTGKITSLWLEKKNGFEATLPGLREYVRKKHPASLSEPKATGETKRLRNSIFLFPCELYTSDIRKGGDEKVTGIAEMWVADVSHYLPKSLLEVLKNSFASILAGVFTGEMLELSDYFAKFFDKGLVPVEFGMRKKDESVVKSKLDFIWYDQVKLDDSVFVIPPDFKIEPVK